MIVLCGKRRMFVEGLGLQHLIAVADVRDVRLIDAQGLSLIRKAVYAPVSVLK